MARWVVVVAVGFWKIEQRRFLEDIRVDHALQMEGPLVERKHEGMVYAREVERSELEIKARDYMVKKVIFFVGKKINYKYY